MVEVLKSYQIGSQIITNIDDTKRECVLVTAYIKPWEHLKEALSGSGIKKEFNRVQYNEVTPRAVKAAFDNPGHLDMKRVNAQQARRILDRIVGF